MLWSIMKFFNKLNFQRHMENKFILPPSNINQQTRLYNFHLKHLKQLRHVSIFSDRHQGVSSFLAKVITYYDLVRFCKQGAVAAYQVT